MLNVAVAGLGGFAGDHHRALAELEAEGVCHVVACADPMWASMGPEVARHRLAARKVALFDDLDSLLEGFSGGLDVVTLPTPIPLHAAQHSAVIAAGAAVYLEKPPTLWWPEFEAMRSVEKDAKKATNVGFNFVRDPIRHRLRERVRAGEFGRLLGVTVRATWPRDAGYYGRNNWAGKLKRGDQWVLDSPMGNGVSHYVQNALFWSGYAQIATVSSRLFRAHPIESFDTAFVEATLADGTWLRVGMTHTVDDRSFERETLIFEDATIVFDRWNSAEIVFSDGTTEAISSELAYGEVLRENLRSYLRYVAGEVEGPTTSLDDCEAFVQLQTLAYLAAGEIVSFPSDRIEGRAGRKTVQGLDLDLDRFVEDGTWPDGPQPTSVHVKRLASL